MSFATAGRTFRRSLSLCAFLLLLPLALADPAAAQTASRCIGCHFARPDLPGQGHLAQWDRSPHGRQNVGCQHCHGGDGNAVEPFLAHRDIIAPRDAKSPLHPSNIPQTCGACHAGPFIAFQESQHFQMLRKGDRRAPVCTTCHGEVDGRVLSPRALESRCNTCHGPNEIAPRAERARNVRQLYEGLSAVREQLKLAATLVRRVEDRARRTELLEAHGQADVPLTRAINAGHKFVYDDLQSSLKLAQTRTEALLAQLANQGRPR